MSGSTQIESPFCPVFDLYTVHVRLNLYMLSTSTSRQAHMAARSAHMVARTWHTWLLINHGRFCLYTERFFRFSRWMLYRYNVAIGTDLNLFFWDNSLYAMDSNNGEINFISIGPKSLQQIWQQMTHSSRTVLQGYIHNRFSLTGEGRGGEID